MRLAVSHPAGRRLAVQLRTAVQTKEGLLAAPVQPTVVVVERG